VNVCDVSPCVSVERDSVGGRALPCPQQRRSEGSWRLEHVLFRACKWGWQCGVHSEVGTDVPDLRVGGVVRVVCVGEGGWSPRVCWVGRCSVFC